MKQQVAIAVTAKLVVVDRERMQKMELQLDSLSKWVHRNLSCRQLSSTTSTTTTARHSYSNDEAQVTSSTCCSTMSSEYYLSMCSVYNSVTDKHKNL